MPLYNFKAKGRLPVVPLSYEFKELVKTREFIVDYSTGDAYVCTDSGELVNIAASDSTMEKFAEYLKNNPDLIGNITVVTPDGEQNTLIETFEKIFERIDALNNKSFLYAGSATDGGPATSAERLNHSLTVIEDDGTTTFDGTENVSINLDKYYKNTGGEIYGDVTLLEKLILTENQMYGTELPATGEEGQLFFLIED